MYISDVPNADLQTGRVFLFRLDSKQQPVIIRQNIGTVDYERGEININALNIITASKIKSGDPILEVSIIPKSNDIIGLQDLYLQLDVSKSTISMVSDTIASGIDLSGTQYIVSSSYLNGEFVRL